MDFCQNDPVRLIHLQNISPEQMDAILKWGPCQPQLDDDDDEDDLPTGKFPEDKINRHFLPKWYKKNLHDGTLGVRDWLSYSPHLDKVFCLYCVLFSKNNSSKTWTKIDFSRWKDAVQILLFMKHHPHILMLLLNIKFEEVIYL